MEHMLLLLFSLRKCLNKIGVSFNDMKAMRQRLELAMKRNEKLKLIFQYPNSPRAIIKSGFVQETAEDGFTFDEIKDGIVVYSYKYIVEIKEDERNEEKI